ncbi:XRE family transcriptional regulator [Kitasatospora sp. NBC_01287]|uniref:XRE family transcriptional regulator n=1 Tax=Kitasatospora sp. NBC_01287 TaxID=2903573 RepID=UPI00224E2096|nr:XRE family transcriptional regulator [Kitasatospora sp. NBC_01287]MCX4750491.1 XRE family transcriptional regulator [Kitasatospora sp. NBC_01287]
MARTLQERLNALFETVHPPDRGPYSNHEVAALLRERDGASLSHVYLWQLRTGRRDNPTRRHLEALASFFGVPAAYFFDDGTADRVAGELAFVSELRSSGVRRVATRVAGLSPQSLAQVLATVEQLRAQEGLPVVPADEATDRNP